MRTCQCCCKMKDGKVIELCGAHDDFVKPMHAEIKELRRVVSESQHKLRDCRVQKQKIKNDLIEEMAR